MKPLVAGHSFHSRFAVEQRDTAMHTRIETNLLLAILLPGISSAAFAASAIATRLDDPKAVYLTAPEFGAHADGKSDDSAALQAAIDKAGSNASRRNCFVPARPLPADAHRLCMARSSRLRLRRNAPRLPAGGQHAGFSERRRRDGDVHRRASGGRGARRLPRAVSAAR